MMLIFKYGDAAKNRNAAQDGLRKRPYHRLVSHPSGGAVRIGGACLLAKSDGQHFLNSAAQRSAKVGVRLDAIEHYDTVGLERGNAEHYIQTVERGADLLNLHAGFERHAHA